MTRPRQGGGVAGLAGPLVLDHQTQAASPPTGGEPITVRQLEPAFAQPLEPRVGQFDDPFQSSGQHEGGELHSQGVV